MKLVYFELNLFLLITILIKHINTQPKTQTKIYKEKNYIKDVYVLKG